MRDLIVFGLNQVTEVVDYYFAHDSEYRVVAFVLDPEYIKESNFRGRPVISVEDMSGRFAPDNCSAFVAVGYMQLNEVRRRKVHEFKTRGYRLASYVSSRAAVLADVAGSENILVMENAVVQPFARIGNNVFIWSGTTISHHSVIEDNCFLAPNVSVAGNVTIGDCSFVGINAIIRDGVTIGKRCVIGAGALILEDCPDEGLYVATGASRSDTPLRY